jgi:regulator of sigma E protease
MGSEGETVTLRVERGGEEIEIPITPFYDEEVSRYRVGFTFAQERERVSLLQSIPFSVQYNAESVHLIGVTLKNLIFKGEGASEVTGPVGTVYVIQEVTQQGGVDIYLEMLALISVNLGMMNLLPIPGLDGSRILFLLVEGIRRKPIKRELEGAIHGAGLILLMALMVMLTYKDIMQIFVK